MLLILCLHVRGSRGNLSAVVCHIVLAYTHRLAGLFCMDADLGGQVSKVFELSNARSDRACLDGAAGQLTVIRTVPSLAFISVFCLFSLFYAVGGTWYAQRHGQVVQ
jgi:hypothetical protein